MATIVRLGDRTSAIYPARVQKNMQPSTFMKLTTNILKKEEEIRHNQIFNFISDLWFRTFN